MVSQHKGPKWDDEGDRKWLSLGAMLVAIWQTALLVEDHMVHYFGFGALLPSKARVPLPKESVVIGVLWIGKGHQCYIGNIVSNSNMKTEGTNVLDVHKNTVCITSARNMGFWLFPPDCKGQLLFFCMDIDSDFEDADFA